MNTQVSAGTMPYACNCKVEQDFFFLVSFAPALRSVGRVGLKECRQPLLPSVASAPLFDGAAGSPSFTSVCNAVGLALAAVDFPSFSP